MRSLRLSRRAEHDLINIWNYTVSAFGKAQAESYLSALEDGLNLILDHPEIGRPADHVAAEYRALTKEHHVIFYRLSKHHIDVIGILHEKMDPKTRI